MTQSLGNFRTLADGSTLWLDRESRKIEAAALAVSKASGFNYTGDNFTGFSTINPRAAKFFNIAEAAIKAYKETR